MPRELFHLVKAGAQEWSTLKGKNLLFLEQILFFKGKPHFGSSVSAKEAIKKSREVFPLVKMEA